MDDDDDIRTLLGAMIEREGFKAKTYASGLEFLAQHDLSTPGCAVIDLVMPDISGTEVVREIRNRGYHLPSIVLTGYGDIDRAVDAMKRGAYDFLQKPIEPDRLLTTISNAVLSDEKRRLEAATADQAAIRLQSLSVREREVLKLIIEGNQSRAIAKTLGISVHTVDNHRAHIMRKLRVDSLADLVRMTCLYAESAGFNWQVK